MSDTESTPVVKACVNPECEWSSAAPAFVLGNECPECENPIRFASVLMQDVEYEGEVY